MQVSLFQKFIRKHWLNAVLLMGLLFLFFHPEAKPWVLRQLFAVGLFKAEIKQENPDIEGKEKILFAFSDSKGNRLTEADLEGKVVLLNFWAPWCPPCRAEMPSLEALYQQFRNDPRFVFLLVDVDADFSRSSTYLQQKNISIPQVVPLGSLSPSLFSGPLPTTVILSMQGTLAWRHEGVANYNNKAFAEQLARLAESR